MVTNSGPFQAAADTVAIHDHQPASWSVAAAEWRQNWRLGAAVLLAIGFSFGAFNALSSLFVMPLQAAFGWSRAQIAFANNAALVTAAAAPFAGRIVDRFGARPVMLIGMPAFAMVYVGFAAMTGSLALFYGLQVLAGVLGLSASGITCSRVIGQAFVGSRGLSLAIARSGLALASATLPTILYAVMTRYSWRAGYLTEAALVLLVSVPAVYFWIGHPRKQTDTHILRASPDLPRWRDLLRQRRVWLVCFGAGLGFAPATAIMGQLQPILVGKGIEPASAAALVGIAGIASFFGTLVTGTLVDRFWAPAIAFIFACGSAMGASMLAFIGHFEGHSATIAVFLIGFGLGAEIDIVAYIVTRYFGVRCFSTLYGLTALSIATGAAIGASSLGLSFDYFGNYDRALSALAIAFFGAGCMYLLLGRYPRNPDNPGS